MTYLKFFNSKMYHILTEDEKKTLCNISNTSSEIFKEYDKTDYPLPQKSETPPENTKMCSKCFLLLTQ